MKKNEPSAAKIIALKVIEEKPEDKGARYIYATADSAATEHRATIPWPASLMISVVCREHYQSHLCYLEKAEQLVKDGEYKSAREMALRSLEYVKRITEPSVLFMGSKLRSQKVLEEIDQCLRPNSTTH